MAIKNISSEISVYASLLRDAKSEDEVNETLQDLLKILIQTISFDVGFISKFENGYRVIEYVSNNDNKVSKLVPGYSEPIENTLCKRSASGMLPDVIFDTKHLPSSEFVEAITTHRIASCLCVPILIDQNKLYGTIALIGHQPNWNITNEHIEVLQQVATLFADWKKTKTSEVTKNSSVKNIVDKIIANGDFELYYQPIFDINSSQAIGFECLTKLANSKSGNTESLFNDAKEAKLTLELELKIMKMALRSLDYFAEHQFLSINLSFATLASDMFRVVLENIPLDRIIIEVNDLVDADRYIKICKSLDTYLAKGLTLCLEDRSLSLIRQGRQTYIDPDVLKLTYDNFQQNQNCELIKWRLNFIHSLAESKAIRLIVQHVENADQLKNLSDNGIRFAQGYYLGKPEPLIKAAYEYC